MAAHNVRNGLICI